jgi:Concanavalin A-like lectin/glucanases superfamily
MRRPSRPRTGRRLAVALGLGLLAAVGLSTTSATYIASADAGVASFSTRVACSAGTDYPAAVIALHPTLYYRFAEPAAPVPSTVADSSGTGNDGTVVAGGVGPSETFGAPSPIWCDTGAMRQPLVDRATTDAGFVVWPTLHATPPDVFTEMAWIQVANGMSTGGRVMGYSNQLTGLSNRYDRHLFLDNAGHVVFGIWTGAATTLTSPGVVNDGKPHQLVASLGPAGGRLYVDGVLVASNSSWTAGENFNGYWRIGWDNLNSWGTGTDPADFGLDGVIDEAAVFDGTELTPAQVATTFAANHW